MKRGTATKHGKQSQKRGTATEHAKQSQKRGTATEHAKQSQKRGTATEHAKQPVVLKPNLETQRQWEQFIEEARADRADDSMEHLLLQLEAFLIFVIQQLQWTSEIDKVFDKIYPRFKLNYIRSDLLVHKKIWDVLNRDKRGVPKDHNFVDWCRRIANHRTEGPWRHVAATEHDDRFKELAKDILAKDLTPDQNTDPKFQLRRNTVISSKQRSFVNVMLRKNLGDARVAYYILDHGLPTLLDVPLRRQQPSGVLAMETLLEELMIWYARCLQWLVKRQNDQSSETSNKKRFHDMPATEQRVLEDYDCGELQKRHDDVRVRKPKLQ